MPSDLRELYKVSRLTYSLRTKCPKTSEKQVSDAIHQLERYGNKVRIDKELLCSQFLVSAIDNKSNGFIIKFTEVARLYLELKGKNKGITFYNLFQRITRYLTISIGDKIQPVIRELMQTPLEIIS